MSAHHAVQPAASAQASAPRDDIFSPVPRRAALLGGAAVSVDAAALSRLLGRGLQQAVPGSPMQWLMLPASDDGSGAADPGQCLMLDSGAGALYLDDGARFIGGLCGIDGAACEDDWPHWMTGAVAGRLAGTPLAGLTAIRRAPPGIATGLVRLAWRLHDGEHAITTCASATAATWLALLDGAALTPLRMAWGQWLPLALSWPVVLAAHRLPAAFFRTLGVGDIIVPDSPRFDCSGRGCITLGRRRFRAVYAAPCHLELLTEESFMHADPIDEVLASAGHEAPEQDDAWQAPDEGGEPHGALDVTLRFELGQLRMTLDALRALGPGSVLELHGATPQAIAIVCGATTVGRGEVVDVEGRLGIRINAWGGAC